MGLWVQNVRVNAIELPQALEQAQR